ncbi:uncharacterized protein TNCV_4821301 [Trichonephila clavipes]|nr:uncharacterized protein TNCV_4821301 [Trichonephila clavipes]
MSEKGQISVSERGSGRPRAANERENIATVRAVVTALDRSLSMIYRVACTRVQYDSPHTIERTPTITPLTSYTFLPSSSIGVVLNSINVELWADWEHIVFCGVSNRCRVWRPPGQREDRDLTIAYHVGPQQGIMFSFNSRRVHDPSDVQLLAYQRAPLAGEEEDDQPPPTPPPPLPPPSAPIGPPPPRPAEGPKNAPPLDEEAARFVEDCSRPRPMRGTVHLLSSLYARLLLAVVLVLLLTEVLPNGRPLLFFHVSSLFLSQIVLRLLWNKIILKNVSTDETKGKLEERYSTRGPIGETTLHKEIQLRTKD